jgi:CRP-like cAMP-binding protein
MSNDSPPAAAAFLVLRDYLAARATFSEADFDRVRRAFLFRRLAAGEYLQRAGDVARYAVFVSSGCLRNYVIDAKGKEHIVQFAPETWWLADSTSLRDRTPTQFFFDAIEDSSVMLIDGPSHADLVQNVGAYATAFRNGLQKHAAAKDERIVSNLSASAEERYLQFLETYPSIALRVPQTMLASYLGMTPETVSRIRKNLSRR